MSTPAPEPKPVGAKKWGKCRGCGENAWLFEYEGTQKNPNDLMCEDCVDEFHGRVHDAEGAREEFYEESGGEAYG